MPFFCTLTSRASSTSLNSPVVCHVLHNIKLVIMSTLRGLATLHLLWGFGAKANLQMRLRYIILNLIGRVLVHYVKLISMLVLEDATTSLDKHKTK